ncbi:MAG TPA: nucleotidyltransferase [Candidatus Avacidaminococcus intestinavium]|uniref:tRNA(Met) cytidine acetate ligase n=1 Tax=Candidatus Avacidaminococcus intestinavium TaxID=2840684 RepID=A0A9D1SM52_9FIRM|nr:nucleotidyltransferase [Candidatus Avacidaminococcus intestinavium]
MLTPCIGIVAEYNPFHNGHAYHLAAAKAQIGNCPVVAVMSGNITQRGLPALTDKWIRAELAVKNGVDLVIELPTIFSCRSAQYFAEGAIMLLNATGIVSHLAFGSENANLSFLTTAAQNSYLLNHKLASKLKKGHSYAEMVAQIISKENLETTKLLSLPNNILAVEYLKALQLSNSKIIPLPIKRKAVMYHDLEEQDGFASATAIRNFLANEDWPNIQKTVSPITTQKLIEIKSQERLGYQQNKLDLLLTYKLRQLSPQVINVWSECSEGLENKFKQANAASSWPEIVAIVKSKRYPATRINRILMQLLLSSPDLNFKAALSPEPAYLRILAFNNNGRALLAKMKNNSTLPLITKVGRNFSQITNNPQFINSLKIDFAATDLYGLIQKNPQPPAKDFFTQPYYFKE